MPDFNELLAGLAGIAGNANHHSTVLPILKKIVSEVTSQEN